MGTLSFVSKSEFERTYVFCQLDNSAVIAAGSVLKIVMSEILMPPTLKPLDGFIVYSGDSEYYKIELAEYMALTNSLPGN